MQRVGAVRRPGLLGRGIMREPDRTDHGSSKLGLAEGRVLLTALGVAFVMWLAWSLVGARTAHMLIAPTAQSTAPSAAASAATSPGVAEYGQAGDAFGGANALFAAIAGALVFWAGYLQAKSLREAQKAYADERQARQREQFEALFFRLLDLNRDLLARLEARTSTDREGAAALDSWAASLVKMLESFYTPNDEVKAKRLVTSYQSAVYRAHPSALGPYFRVLFQVFKHIDEADLTPREKVQYANIARGQISEGAVLLLAANGLTMRGHRFIPLIERYGLLEHMHPTYLESFRDALRLGYQEHAFLGSGERQALPWGTSPKLPAGYLVDVLQEPIVAGGVPANPGG